MEQDKSAEKNEILEFISQTHRQEFDRRRVYEWRVLFSILTLYVLSVAGKLSGKLNLSSIDNFQIYIWVGFIGLSIVSIWYLFHIHAAHGVNKHIAEVAERALILKSGEKELIEVLGAVPENVASSVDPKLSVLKNNWAWRWQVVTIMSVSVAASVIVSS